MSSFMQRRRRLVLRPLTIAGMAPLMLTTFLVNPQPAAAHGSAIDRARRPADEATGTATARDAGYNGSLAPGASTTFGVLGTWLGTNGDPTMSCTATRQQGVSS